MEKSDISATGSDPSLHSNEKEHEAIKHVPAPIVPATEAVAAADKAADPSEEEHEYVTGFKLLIIMISVTLVAFLMLLDTSIIATAIPKITTDFHSLNDVGWYGSSYLLASASLQPLTGKFYTYFSSKWTFLTFLGVFEFGSLLCGVAVSSKMLIVGRAVAGMGSAGLVNGALTIIAACVPLEKRPMNLGILMGIAQLGIVLGPLLGGALTQYTTWRYCFYINLPAGGAVAFLLLLIQIPDRTTKREKSVLGTLGQLDLIGFAIFAPAAIQFLLALQWGGTLYPWGDAKIIGLFCGAAGTFAVFVAWQYYVGDEAMIPLSMVRQRIVWCSCLTTLSFFGSVMITAYYLPIYFQTVRDATPTMSGVYLLPMILSQMILAVLSGFLVGKLGYYLPWIIASGVLVSIGAGLLTLLSISSSTGTWIGYQILLGIGRGCGMQMPIVAIQNAVTPKKISIGMSLVMFSQTFGGALYLALAETDFTSSLKNALVTFAPNVDAEAIVLAGASGVRSAVTDPSDLAKVLLAYNKAIVNVFYLGIGASVAILIFGSGIGWVSVKKPKAKPVSSEA